MSFVCLLEFREDAFVIKEEEIYGMRLKQVLDSIGQFADDAALQITNATVVSMGEMRRKAEQERQLEAAEQQRMSQFPSLASNSRPAAVQPSAGQFIFIKESRVQNLLASMQKMWHQYEDSLRCLKGFEALACRSLENLNALKLQGR